jgi:hypothetical protein
MTSIPIVNEGTTPVTAAPTPPSVAVITDQDWALQEAETARLDGFSGVHDVLKTVDYWFEREVHSLEQEAEQLALQWAEQNLPTLHANGNDPLPPEDVLAKHAGQIWRSWPERMQVKMQDAIDGAAAVMARSVAEARAALVEMKLTRLKMEEAESRIEELRRESELHRGPIQYVAMMGKWTAVSLSVLLVIVEFIANQPVFRILWPMNSEVSAALRGEIRNVPPEGLWSGIELSLREIVSFFEASMLALVVVVILFLLAKTFGLALRPLFALRSEDHPFASRSISAMHRQKKVLLWASGIGTAFVLIFLVLSRSMAPTVAEGRVPAARSELTRLVSERDSLLRARQIVPSELSVRILQAKDKVEQLESDLAFAQNIAQNNVSILLLNVSLVAFALVIGFMGDARDVNDTLGEHPDLKPLKDKCLRLTEAQVVHSGVARRALLNGELALGQLQSLLRSRPLATIDAKRSRLNAIIPRWRSTNVRRRGIDAASVEAFRRSPALALVDIGDSIPMVKPAGTEDYARDLQDIRDEVFTLERSSATSREAME